MCVGGGGEEAVGRPGGMCPLNFVVFSQQLFRAKFISVFIVEKELLWHRALLKLLQYTH